MSPHLPKIAHATGNRQHSLARRLDCACARARGDDVRADTSPRRLRAPRNAGTAAVRHRVVQRATRTAWARDGDWSARDFSVHDVRATQTCSGVPMPPRKTSTGIWAFSGCAPVYPARAQNNSTNRPARQTRASDFHVSWCPRFGEDFLGGRLARARGVRAWGHPYLCSSARSPRSR